MKLKENFAQLKRHSSHMKVISVGLNWGRHLGNRSNEIQSSKKIE